MGERVFQQSIPTLPPLISEDAPIPATAPARLGRVYGVPLVAPLVLGVDVRSAGVKHIAVINVTKNNLELSNLIPGMV